MSAMLLREGESLVSAPLRPEQTHILLRLWAYSASRLRQWYVETFQGVNISGEKATNKGNQRTRSADDVSRLSSWEALSTVLKNSGAKLLTQFRDSSPELSLVIDLLRCYDVNASFSGDKTFKSFKAVLKTTTDLFESLPDRDILIKLAELFSSWYALDGTASSSTSITIKSLLQSLWQSITGNYEVLQNIATGTSSSSKGSKRKSSSRGNSQEDGRDTAYNLNVSLFKYSALWKMMNCRQLVDLKEEEIFTILKDICAQTISIAESQSNALLKNNTFEGDLAATCTSSVAVMHTILLWLTRSLYLVGVKVRQETASGVSPTEDAVTAMTEQVVHLRDSLLETLCAWMTTDIDQELGTRFNQFHRVLQRTAFRLVGDIRMLFQARAATCKIVEGVAYIPAQDVLGALRKVFELEGQRLRSNIREIEEVDEEEANRLATVLVHSLLNPLSYSLYFDIENLNRRQAAAVLCYSLEPQKVISDNVKATMKSLKDRDAVKYLEVQMVALKSVFHEHVVTHIRRKTQAESGDAEDSGFDFDECERQVEAGLDNVIALARKFAGSFGIGRVKDPTLLEALLRFFELAIDLTFSEEENIGFVSAMEPYIRLIQSDKCSLIKNYLETKISSKTDIAHQLASNQRAGLPLDMRSLLSFRDKISGSVGSNKRTRCGKVTDEEEEEVDDDIHAGAVQSKVVSVDASSSRRGPSWGPSATHTSFRLGGASQIASQSSVGVRYPMSKPAMTQSKSQLSQPTRSKVVEDFIDDDGMDNDAGDHDDDDDDESENDSEAPKLGTGTRLNYSMSPIAHRDSRQTTHRPSMLSSINDSAFSHPAMGLMLDDLADDSAFQSLGYRREGEPGGPRGGSGEGVRGDDKEDKDDNVDDDEDEEDEFAQLSKISKRKYAL